VRHLALAAIGRDRPGIAAAVADCLLAHAVNVEDSRMAILRGHFTMMLVLAAPDGADVSALGRDLERVREGLGLEALTLSELAELDPRAAPATLVLTVYGADHPGIVHAVTAALAARDVNITDLQTRLVGDAEGVALYAMVLEVAPPAGVGAEELAAALGEVGSREGVEVSVRELERDAL